MLKKSGMLYEEEKGDDFKVHLCKSTEIYLCFCAYNGSVKYIVPVVIGLKDD